MVEDGSAAPLAPADPLRFSIARNRGKSKGFFEVAEMAEISSRDSDGTRARFSGLAQQG